MTRREPCSKEVLTLYHYDELEPEARDRLERHLEHCRACRDELRKLKSFSRALGSMPEPAPQVLRRIESRVLKGRSRRKPGFHWTGLAFGGGLAAALLFFVLLRPEAPAPVDATAAGMLSQVEILEQYELLEDLDMLEDFELLTEIGDLG